ncbi:MAG: hypothetical protein ABR968_02745 [Bacteroidales bacterium]|jgi:hypothetical protein
MKKTLIIIIIFASIHSFSQDVKAIKKTDLEKMNLKGNIKTIYDTLYNVVDKFGELKKEVDTDSTLIFNDKGNLVEVSLYNHNGSLIHTYTYKYDENGNKIEKEYKENTKLDPVAVEKAYKYTWKYDSKGNVIEENKYSNYLDKLLNKWISKYDDNGNIIEYNTYNSDGSPESKYIYMYDDKGKIIKEENNYNTYNVYNYGQIINLYKITWKYDSSGNKTKEKNILYNKNENANYNEAKVIWKYDNKGKLIEENQYSAYGNLVYKYTYKYDDKGNMIEKDQNNSKGSLISKWITKYDNKGNKIEESEYNKDSIKRKIISTFEYDTNGNWIKRTDDDNDYSSPGIISNKNISIRVINY